MIITAGRLGEQLCWSEPRTGFSARTGRCEPQPAQPVAPADPADLAAQHHPSRCRRTSSSASLGLTPAQHHQAAQQTAREQVDSRGDHSATISSGEPAQAKAKAE